MEKVILFINNITYFFYFKNILSDQTISLLHSHIICLIFTENYLYNILIIFLYFFSLFKIYLPHLPLDVIVYYSHNVGGREQRGEQRCRFVEKLIHYLEHLLTPRTMAIATPFFSAADGDSGSWLGGAGGWCQVCCCWWKVTPSRWAVHIPIVSSYRKVTR